MKYTASDKISVHVVTLGSDNYFLAPRRDIRQKRMCTWCIVVHISNSNACELLVPTPSQRQKHRGGFLPFRKNYDFEFFLHESPGKIGSVLFSIGSMHRTNRKANIETDINANSKWIRYFSANNLKSPMRSATRIPIRLAFEEYEGPIPFFVVPKDLLPFSCSCRPSTCCKYEIIKKKKQSPLSRFSLCVGISEIFLKHQKLFKKFIIHSK